MVAGKTPRHRSPGSPGPTAGQAAGEHGWQRAGLPLEPTRDGGLLQPFFCVPREGRLGGMRQPVQPRDSVVFQ